jgi:predicted phosphohydrolase
MKLLLVSDLHMTDHLLNKPHAIPYVIESLGADDVICVAGDVSDSPTGMNKHLKALRDHTDATILAVMGNHDYYYRTLSLDTIDRARDGLPERVHVLENETVVVGDVRILGCTLWTDADQGLMAGNALGMQDYDLIKASPERQKEGAIFIEVEDTVAWNQVSKNWLASELAQPFDGKTVVMTHHAPSFRSQQPKYAYHPLASFFCCDMDDLIEEHQPDYWLHGHLHDAAAYVIGQKTKVRCNPRGYTGERKGPYKPLIIDLGD